VCVQDGKSVVSGSGDRTVRVWDVATGKAVQQLEGHSAAVTSVSFSPVRVCRARARQWRARSVWLVGVLVLVGWWVGDRWRGVGVVRPRPAAACVCVACMVAWAFVCCWCRVGVVVGVGSSGGDTARVRV
jgi:hypothetical protein